jgi:transcriptional regulator with XRE-family HTH domain
MEQPLQDLPTGDRIQIYRTRKGITQATLGGLVGRSEDWVSKVERNIIPVDSVTKLTEIARVLGVRDLAELTGRPLALAPNGGPEHSSVAAIRASMSQLPGLLGDTLTTNTLAPPELATKVADAWQIYDHDTNRYTALGPLLPTLLGEAHRTVRNAADQAPAATRSLIEVYNLLQVYLKRLGERDLARIAADRALSLATNLGDPVLIGAAAWNLCAILTNRGEAAESLDLAFATIGTLTPIPDDASPEYISVYGALHVSAVIAAARSGKPKTGWELLHKADGIARRLGGDRNDWRTSFGPTNVAMHGVHLAGEEGDAAEALRLADNVEINPALPLERRTRYLVEVMNASRLRRDDLGTLYMLKAIETESPEEIKYYPLVREALRDLLKREKATYKRDLRGLATRVGVIG